MTTPEDFYTPDPETTVRAQVVGYMQAAGLDTTAFLVGDPEQQILEAMVAAGVNLSALVAQQIRMRASLDTATDPGDVDPYDATNEAATPAPGGLSFYGAGFYGTPRITETFARGTFTVTNASGGAIYIAPEQVTFAHADYSSITYRNEADEGVYTNPDGTATIANGDTLDITIVCETLGTDGNAGAGDVELVTSLGTGVTGTNATAILAQDREDADAYRARCGTAAGILSLNGPKDAYEYIALSAQKDGDGNIFFFPPFGDGVTALGVEAGGTEAVSFPNARGIALGINRVHVQTNADGTLDVYIAGPGGDPGALVLSDYTALIDAVYWPETVGRTIHRASNVAVTIDGTVKAKAGAGVTAAVVATAIDDAINDAFPLYPIGGFDQSSGGAGTLYLNEVSSLVNGAHAKIYTVSLSSPAGNTALALGQVAVPTNNIIAGDVTIA